ncbi:4-alpha-glucanotransferase [Pseudomonas sp. BGr12]|uniref:4-alpha-glucanotransferase n=1 Tax=unclassified Pseudomonas TaxID=196821 RepID=UPI00178358B2|nr:MULTISPECIES: 4-alpha-glucanotransferase [unclassified Pseudomonas]MBD9579120.1 4-alpha-glucanotransferase [Pseudomonas sp. PDM23]MBD9672894.1 4-alpha-glucanotransferase [Pseudomonas sp. PDM21]MDL2428217.1 4-alpha-glucanotransferase [Pseudomonas sp. BJa5]
MSDAQLERLASEAGLAIDWMDADNRPQRLTAEVQRSVLEALGFPARSPEQIRQSLDALERRQAELPPLITADQGQPIAVPVPPGSRYKLFNEDDSGHSEGQVDEHGQLPAIEQSGYYPLHLGEREIILAVAPPRCPSVAQYCGGRQRVWGLSAQLYSLRREQDGGAGDIAALAQLVRAAAGHGADAIAISPVHAMFPASRQIYSPYSPSSRLLFNELYAAPGLVLGDEPVREALAAAGLGAELARLQALPLIDWLGVAHLRDRLLTQLYGQFQHDAGELHEDFLAFRNLGGAELLQHCCFQVLQLRRAEAGDGLDWRFWPEDYRNAGSTELGHFMVDEEQAISQQAFGQWLIARGLRQVQTDAKAAGMGIGLIADLAVGAEPSGSQAWMRQDELLTGVSVGCPPDILNRAGQNWGICAFSPDGLRRNGFRAFIEMLRANLRYVGGLRIDHILGLRRLWVIPAGAEPQDGAYLDYPIQDLLRLICLEAERAQAIIIGEDLGTVPPGLREALAERGILGMRVLLFEQQHGRFIAPAQWPDNALATSTTHDLPTLEGWQKGRDIDWREQLGQRSRESAADERNTRQHESFALRRALGENQIQSDPVLDGAIELLGATPAPLVLLPLEDALACIEQPNLPGPGDAHPNWRRRFERNAAEMLDDPQVRTRMERLRRARNGGREHG